MKKLLNKKRSLHRQSIKFDLKMKLSTLLMFVAVFTLQANTTYSQKTKVSLDLINVPVGHVLEEIESKTEQVMIDYIQKQIETKNDSIWDIFNEEKSEKIKLLEEFENKMIEVKVKNRRR